MRSCKPPGVCFNSKLVRLKGTFRGIYDLSRRMFQFQTGSIKSLSGFAKKRFCGTFQFQTGSIKSRRKPNPSAFVPVFQFQTGSIKSLSPIPESTTAHPFQFQTGSIKSQALTRILDTSKPCFNSKLVRLKGNACESLRHRFCLFQFQTGSIKRKSGSPAGVFRRQFQFQTGSIKSKTG